MAEDFRQAALEYHAKPRPGKIEVVPSKPLANQHDLSVAYSPGVAAPCEAIVADADAVGRYTARSNLVGVITNGTAVLGLGDIGPLAAKPVMEGKAVLFKNFAGIDVFDIEIDEHDPQRLVDVIASLEPTFGGINLEDIKAPECFEVEEQLRERLSIPVFHDDQHGTAIITAAAITNALELVGKRIEEVRVVTSGAGAAAIACLRLLERMGLRREHVLVTDRCGVVYVGRAEEMDRYKARYARETEMRTLAEAIEGADVFLGLSVGNLLTPEMVRRMAERPVILALANPQPEILPEVARAARPDAIIATGRSDYPNQVNNVLCFPYLFRGALDVGARCINDEMKIACVRAIAEVARAEASDVVAAAYGGEEPRFGPDYLIPKPFDPRLILSIAPAVAEAAMASGVATRPIADLEAYREDLNRYVFKSVFLMKPVFSRARDSRQRIAYADGEHPRVLRAVQAVVDERLARPVLVGRPRVISRRINELGLRLRSGRDYEVVNPESDRRYREYWQAYYELMRRRGVSPADAQVVLRTNTTVIAALLVRRGAADAMLCGQAGHYHQHLKDILDVLGLKAGVHAPSALTALALKRGTYFVCDTHVAADPDAEAIADSAAQACEYIRRFGITPRVAMLSHSNFGSSDQPGARKMAEARRLLRQRLPELEVEGEMQGDAALLERVRRVVFPDAELSGEANLLMMPNLDAANIAMNLLHVLADGGAVGPILLGPARAAHILVPGCTVRRIINMTALAAADALIARERGGAEPPAAMTAS